MEGDYVYKPLRDPGNIRILVLEPAPNLSDPLIAHLEEEKLEDASYTALSYSWAMEDDKYLEEDPLYGGATLAPGVSSPVKPLELDGSHVLVGENLRDALRRLRKSSTQAIRVWVDAICINQRDNSEKSSQVGRMGTIYRNAAKVVAWLGEGNEGLNCAADIAIRCIIAGRIAAKSGLNLTHNWAYEIVYAFHDWSVSQDYPCEKCAICSDAGIASTAMPHHSRSDALMKTWKRIHHSNSPARIVPRVLASSRTLYGAWRRWHIPGTNSRYVPPADALVTLSRRRYFTRRWVTQEVMIPQPGGVVFWWGGYRSTENLLHLSLELFITLEMGIFHVMESPMPPTHTTSEPLGPEYKWSLCEWMSYCSEKRCSDPRDRLYAVLGCLSQPISIQPDYSQALPLVGAEFVKHMLATGYILPVLFNSSGRSKPHENLTDSLPTWMPDLHHFYHKPQTVGSSDQGWEYAQPSISNDCTELSCHLAYLGTVEAETLGTNSRRGYHIFWQEGRRHTVHMEVSSFSADRDVSRVRPFDRFALWSPQDDSMYEPGDMLCAIPDPSDDSLLCELVLRPIGNSNQCRIVGVFFAAVLHYQGTIKPQVRRLFRLV